LRRLLVLAPAAWLLPCASASAAPTGQRRPAERAWMERSAALARAAKAHANVGDFRRDVQEHRERLRGIVRAAGKPAESVAELHRSMILMNALLHAASECHAGGRLQCPPELMRQIEHQLAVGFRQLGALEKGAA
jgi:hypothetical protein